MTYRIGRWSSKAGVLAGTVGAALVLVSIFALSTTHRGASRRTESDHARAAFSSSDHSSLPTWPLRKINPDIDHLTLAFEPSAGRSSNAESFVARAGGSDIKILPAEVAISLGKASRPRSNLTIKFLGANQTPSLAASERLAGVTNYYLGKNPRLWRTQVPTFARVVSRSVYPGIDVVYYGTRQRLEYDLNIASGRDVGSVRLSIKGADKLNLERDGDLAIVLHQRRIYLRKPFIYQDINGVRKPVDGGYALLSDSANGNETALVGIRVGNYDRGHPLVVDPVLSYSTYLGGAGADVARGVALDSSKNNYITGTTCSTNFPTVLAAQPTAGGDCDAFVTEINSTGTTILYSTYLGGSGLDRGNAIAVDGSGAAYVSGQTASTNFPITVGQPFGGVANAFVTKLKPNGMLSYARYLGGSDVDAGLAIALAQGCASNCNAYVAGRSNSQDFPTTVGAFQTSAPAAISGFVTQVSSDGTSLVYSTYLGGPANQPDNFSSQYASAVAVDGSGNAYVAGGTISTAFPVTEGAAQTTIGGAYDCFAAKLNPSATAPLVYSTYVGGHGNEGCTGIAIVPSCQSNCAAWIAGFTSSFDYPSGGTPPFTHQGGVENGVLTEISPDGSSFVYSTYLGGYYNEALGIAVDSNSNAYVTGFTASANYPTVSPIQGAAAPNGILFASTDGFSSFAQSSLPSSAGSVYTMISGGGALYAGTTRRGLFRSSDGGTSFTATAITGAFVSGLAFDSSANTLYAGVPNGLMASSDGGATFTANLLPQAVRVLSILVIPNQDGPSTVLAGTDGGLYASFDGGVTFGATPQIPASSVFSLVFDPNAPSTVYAGTNEGLFRSTDGGNTFVSYFLTFSDIVALAADPTTTPTTIYIASSSNDLGVFTTNFVNFFNIFENDENFYSLALDTTTEVPTAYTASANGDIYTSTNRGVSFAPTSLANQAGPMTMVAATPSGLFAGEFLEADAFLTTANPAGTTFTFSTFLQGSSSDFAYGVGVDPPGTTIHIAGKTASGDFPVSPSPGAAQTALAGNTDAFLSVYGPTMSQGGQVPTPPPPPQVQGKAGGTVGAGALTVNNTSGAPMLTPSVTIAFNNADLFTSATLTATVGTSNQTSTLVPNNSSTFIFNPPITIPLGQNVTYSLSVTITPNPQITRRQTPIAYASILPVNGSRDMAEAAAALIFLGMCAYLLGISRANRMMLVLAILLLAMTAELGCDTGSIGSPSGAQFSTQTAMDVAAHNQTGGPLTVGGLPVVLSNITVQ